MSAFKSIDPTVEYGISLPTRSFTSGADMVAALVADAQKTLPSGTCFQIISFGHKKGLMGWVVNPKGERASCKVLQDMKL